MRKIRLLLAAALVLGTAGIANATVSVLGVAITPKFVDKDGANLAFGSLVRIGSFSSEASLGSSNSLSALNAIFTPLGEGIANAGTLSEAGQTTQTTMFINEVAGPGTLFANPGYDGISATYLPTGTQLYAWVFNSTSTATATQWGIFKAPGWVFPPDLASATVSTSSAGVTVLRGTNDGTNLRLAPVPEPTSFGLLALGSVLLVARRRR